MQSAQGLKPYRTVRQASEVELTVQKSRFIGRCLPVADAEAAGAALARIRKQHGDASHNCYAYCVGVDVMGTRSSDDGEPSGTAGVPILNVLNRLELTDTLCVVTRYFGGILLGTGGLARAYSGAASSAAEAAGIVTMRPMCVYAAVFSYPLWAAAEPTLRKMADVDEVNYTDVVTVGFRLFDGQADGVLTRIRDLTDGRVEPAFLRREMHPVA